MPKRKPTRSKKKLPILPIIILIVLVAILPVIIFFFRKQQELRSNAAGETPFLYAAIDTMKETKDTGNTPLTDAEIESDLRLYAGLNNNFISISVPYDFDEYYGRWVAAIRKTGKHIWHRSHWNQWENDYGTTGTMQPADYIAKMDAFIRQHPTFYQSGDIFDGCAECENGRYWGTTQFFADDYNKMLMDLTKTADTAFAAIGVTGIDAKFHSSNGTVAEKDLYPETVQYMGRVVTDSYVSNYPGVPPQEHADAEKEELDRIYNKHKVPIILGEYGFSTGGDVSDAEQQAVLKVVFDTFKTIPYLQGLNYWVGYGGNTAIFSGDIGNLTYRPAAAELAAFFAGKLQQSGVSATPIPSVSTTPIPATPTPPYVSPTLNCLGACPTIVVSPTTGQNPLAPTSAPTQAIGISGEPSIGAPSEIVLPPQNPVAPGQPPAPDRQNLIGLLLQILQQILQLLSSLLGRR